MSDVGGVVVRSCKASISYRTDRGRVFVVLHDGNWTREYAPKVVCLKKENKIKKVDKGETLF